MNPERTYRDLCPQGTPEAVRREHNIGDIFLNQAKCLVCGDVIASNHRHDFVWCSCKGLAVDGGSWMSRRYIPSNSDYEEMTVPYEEGVASSIE